jgi:hypothetical protein
MPTPRRVLDFCLALALAVGVAACSSRPDRTADAPPLQAAPEVHRFGGMRQVMRLGEVEARALLLDWAGGDTIAVGAVEGLDGEITALDGAVWVSRVRAGVPATSGPEPAAGDRATLLIAARVPSWRSIPLEAAAGGRDLEAMIEQAAARAGIDTAAPFPFVIEGRAASLDMHIINGFCPHGGEPDPGSEPWRFVTSDATDVTIVGFFARDAAGELTHHGTSMHAHALVRLGGRLVTGHIDSLGIEAGATLRVPNIADLHVLVPAAP